MKYSFIHKIVVPNTILIVDDDEMNRDVLGNIFSASHSIEMAENGKECLNKTLEYGQKFCAILLDVVMNVSRLLGKTAILFYFCDSGRCVKTIFLGTD